MKFTKDQLLAIESRNKDLLISASAGTGKTAVLIERVYRLLAEDGVDISRMLVVTYTEKAARELKSRLAAKLNEAIEEDAARAPLLEEQLEKLEWADISTIHSFCKKVAVQNFSVSKIDPAARVLDEGEKAVLLYEVLESLLREKLDEEELEPAIEAYTDLKDKKKLRALLIDLYTQAASYDEPRSFLARTLERSQARRLASSLLRLALGMTERYRAKKEQYKLMDFDDMQYYALAALEDEAVRESYREAYDYIFVDEYQDTSYVQDRLIGLIAREGSLFIVGDYKQSIYGFRNARPELFLKKYEDYKNSAKAECIRLNENFRSEVQVIDAVNEVFSAIMTRDCGGIDYEHEARLLLPEKEGGAATSVEVGPEKRTRLNLIDKGSKDEDENYAEDYAYHCLIRRIKELKADFGYSYNDICVLMRSPNTDARKMKRLFEEEGLSLSIDIEEDVLHYPEIKTLMDFLKLLVHPFDDEALLAVLRSPIGTMDDDELFELALVKKELKLTYYAELFSGLDELTGEAGLRPELRAKLKALGARLDQFRKDESALLRDRLQRLINESDYLHYLLGRQGREYLESSLYEFLDFIYEFERQNGSNINLFVEGYEDLVKSDKKVKASKVSARAGESVKLLSIHKSKGLQFKVVILFGAEKAFKAPGKQGGQFKDYAFDEEGGLQLNLIEKSKGVTKKNPFIEEAALRQAAAERLEEQRLFYVALTRAERKLEIMMSAEEEGFKKRMAELKGYGEEAKTEPKRAEAKSYMDWLISALDMKDVYDFDFRDKNRPLVFGNHWEFCVLSLAQPAPEAVGAQGLRLGTEAIGSDGEDIAHEGGKGKRGPLPSFTEVSYPRIVLPMRRSVTSLKQAFQREEFDYTLGSLGKDGARRGTLYHHFMQHFILNAKSLEDFLRLNEKKRYLTDEDLALIDLDKIRVFTEHSLFERINKAKKVWKEKAFIYQKEIDGKLTQIQGIMDLAFLEKKSLVILDYKSDRLKKRKDFIDLYQIQLDLYAEALTNITGFAVTEKLIYSFELGELIEL